MQMEQNKTRLITGFFARCIPVVLAAYWPVFAFNSDLSTVILRPTLLLSALILGVCLIRLPITKSEVSLLKAMGLMWMVLLVTSLAADNVPQALTEWVKLVLIQVFAILLARGLRDEFVARIFGRWMLICAVVTVVFMLYVYVKQMGFTIPTYEALRVMKGHASKAHMPLNPISGCAILTFICAACLLPRKLGLVLSGALVFLVSGFMTGSRASFAVPAVAAFIVMMLAWTRSKSGVRAIVGWTVLASCLLVGLYESVTLNRAVLAKFTEGRSEVWTVALTKFSERPVFGYGYMSWKDDLVSRLPGEYAMTRDLAHGKSGGYHNEFLTALAEQGTIGFVAVSTLFGFLFLIGKKLSFGQCYRSTCGKMALFLIVFLILRATVELDGLFGNAQDPYDFLAYIAAAILVSRASLEDSYAVAVLQTQRNAYTRRLVEEIQRRRQPKFVPESVEPVWGEKA